MKKNRFFEGTEKRFFQLFPIMASVGGKCGYVGLFISAIV
jgi:hypothetical protein